MNRELKRAEQRVEKAEQEVARIEQEIEIVENKLASGLVEEALLKSYGVLQKSLDEAMNEWESATEYFEMMKNKCK